MCLTGLLPPTQGKAWLWGKEVDANDMATRYRVGFMPQGFSLYGGLTVQQNLQLRARLYHLSATTTRERIEELVDRFGLTPHRNQKADSLPLGIRQRLSLAVDVVHEPEMLILDEPTSGVDPVARDQFWDFLIDLSRNQNVTIFISTHFMNEAMRCDRISLMHAGKALAQDSPQSIASSHGGGVHGLEGAARVMGTLWPAAYYRHLSIGTFTKGLSARSLIPDLVKLAMLSPVFWVLCVLLLKKQEK